MIPGRMETSNADNGLPCSTVFAIAAELILYWARPLRAAVRPRHRHLGVPGYSYSSAPNIRAVPAAVNT